MINHKVYDKDPVIAKNKAEGRVGVPFGYKPQGLTELGWLTRRRALAAYKQRSRRAQRFNKSFQ